jgi:hypothetical protein
VKADLHFDLSEIDDELALNRSLKATDMALVLFEIQYNLRKKCEWELESLEADSDKWDGLEVVFRKLMELFDEHNINLNDLIR